MDTERTIERVSGEDLMELAAESAGAPWQVAAVLVLARSVDLDQVRRRFGQQVPAVARLRQRLLPAPPGCGRPIWVDDARFSVDQHVTSRTCPVPGDVAAVYDLAADLATAPLPRDRPLWSATLVSGLADGRTALVFVVHHVLADGIGGLAVLAQLVDGAAVPPQVLFPRPAPTAGALFRQAGVTRVHAVLSAVQTARLMRMALAELRVGHVRPPRRCSLNAPTGSRRRFRVARADLQAVQATAHRSGGTVNDVVLAAVGGALGRLLDARGESAELGIASVVVSVPVSARSTADATELGNRVGVVPVTVPVRGPAAERLAVVARETRARRGATGRGASAELLGPAFRALARVGLLRWFVNRQRLVTTFVTNIRGPQDRYAFAGVPVTEIVAVSPTNGNITTAFAAMSYAGVLRITVLVDPARCPELELLAGAVQEELDVLCPRTPRTAQP